MRFGSASVRTRPTCSKAWMLPEAWLSPVEPAVFWMVEIVPSPPFVQVRQTTGSPLRTGLALAIFDSGWVVVLRLGPAVRPPSSAPLMP